MGKDLQRVALILTCPQVSEIRTSRTGLSMSPQNMHHAMRVNNTETRCRFSLLDVLTVCASACTCDDSVGSLSASA
jgi:hypothetical protein